MTLPQELACSNCGAVRDVPALDERLWDLYYRLKSGVQNYEPLVYDSDWLQENVMDDDDHAAVMHSMGRDMANRGLCPKCGKPDLRGKTEDDFYTEEEAREMHEMWAEQAAERRAGC